ncbi:N-acetyltransferase [Halobacteriales archaeon QS_9_70_65]|nr:MAG: N-acetyltransferase [Halobacteriales archaeon QS_9_70_65]
MTIRPADPDDIDAVRRIAERSWAADYPDILSRETAEAAAEEWYGADSLAAELDAERTLLSVVEADDRVVGFAHATWNDDEGYILGNEFYERFGFERADESETVIDGESYRENRYVLDV